MGNKWLVFVFGLILGGIITFLFAPGRYEMTVHQVGVATRLDTATGTMVLCKMKQDYTYECPVKKKQ